MEEALQPACCLAFSYYPRSAAIAFLMPSPRRGAAASFMITVQVMPAL